MAAERTAPERADIEKAMMHIIAHEPVFAIGEAEIRGNRYRAFVNAPGDLRGLIALCDAHGAATAVVCGEDRWTYADLAAKSRAVASGLAQEGVAKGDHVALAMRNSPEWMACYLGIAALGAVVVPLNGWWTADEMAFALEHCGASFVIADPEQGLRITPSKAKLGFRLAAAGGDLDGADTTLQAIMDAGANTSPPAVEIAPDDDLAVMYTSGSTGKPKGVVLTHRAAWSSILSFALVAASVKATPAGAAMVPENPSILVALPFFHVTGSHPIFMLSVLIGRKMVLMRKWSPDEAIRLIKAEAITNFVGVPTMSYELMLKAREMGEPLDSLLDLGSGGAKRPASHVARLSEQFPRAWSSSGYGLTESSALGTYAGMADYQRKPGAAGRPLPPLTDVKTVAEDGQDCAPGEPGEVWIRTPGNFRCYLHDPDSTDAALTPDGWLKTGDMGEFDEEGFLSIVDRLKDMIVRGGENVACLEVEAALCEHTAIREAAVFSVPDERLGETVGAAIVADPAAGLEASDIAEFLKDRLAAFKRPEHVWIVHDPLPRIGSEKFDKRSIRKRCLAGDF
ncbi:class I adenylate-forming enzyme family protein [Hyphobacterium marinum]|uniref:Class I adenylate-forming enzyme family protein n=1 Tax=Hyphobacterium marinum TaxID=3116574 RepID=A0ABU7M1I3_9PROT|nr:class I adenylate-forming enzyme family protein [Hyphobacterium sp. Y6023]MEE2567683.1 class I adenylate-forming enzyme family protein [Hyphobacterium sp. Y6023]